MTTNLLSQVTETPKLLKLCPPLLKTCVRLVSRGLGTGHKLPGGVERGGGGGRGGGLK